MVNGALGPLLSGGAGSLSCSDDSLTSPTTFAVDYDENGGDAGSSFTIIVESTADDGGNGPQLKLYRASATPLPSIDGNPTFLQTMDHLTVFVGDRWTVQVLDSTEDTDGQSSDPSINGASEEQPFVDIAKAVIPSAFGGGTGPPP